MHFKEVISPTNTARTAFIIFPVNAVFANSYNRLYLENQD